MIATRVSLAALLDELPPAYRHPVVLRDVEQLAYDEIGVRLGLGEATVRSRVARGRALRRRSPPCPLGVTRVPDRIGRYRVEGVIGSGGFATVYRARDERLDAPVALKVLAENRSLDAEVRERFVAEGHLLRRIGGADLVAVHDLGETDRQQPFLVLDLADQGDLAQRVAQRRGQGWEPTEGDVLLVARFLADALGAVHGCHVVHRDIAPANVLIRSRVAPAMDVRHASLLDVDESFVLADLGLSKDLARHSGFTVGGGTSGFTPPEQRSASARIDARADLWSASAVLVWLLTDQPPDDAGTWRRRLADVAPRALVQALGAGLSQEPGSRPGDTASWLASVEGALRSPPRPAVQADVASPAPRRRGRAAAVAMVAAVVLVGALLAARGPDASVEALGDGIVRAEREGVAIVGPAEVDVGSRARYVADVQGPARWIWTGFDGAVSVDAPVLEVRASAPGSAVIRLLGVGGDGRTTEVELELVVVE